MVDCLVLKLMHPKTAHELERCISKYQKICLVFLFQRAVSAIFSWKVRSPQAWIPALTAVQGDYSRLAWEGAAGSLLAGRWHSPIAFEVFALALERGIVAVGGFGRLTQWF